MNFQLLTTQSSLTSGGDITMTVTQTTTVTLESPTTLMSVTSAVTSSSAQTSSLSTVDIPIDFGTSEPNSSLITGLCIGLPVAVIVILLLVIVVHAYREEWSLQQTIKSWFQRDKVEDNPPKSVYLPSYCDGGVPSKNQTQSSLKLPMGDPFTDTVALPSPVVIKQSPAKITTLTRVKDRLSRLVHIQDFSDLQSGSTNGALMQASGGVPSRNPQIETSSLTTSQVSNHLPAKPDVNVFSPPPKLNINTSESSNLDSEATRYPSSIIRDYIKPRDSSQAWDRDVHLHEFVVIRNYTRRLGDELTLRIGDRVAVHTDFPDGWSEVSITKYAAESTASDRKNDRDRGVVPTICIHKI